MRQLGPFVFYKDIGSQQEVNFNVLQFFTRLGNFYFSLKPYVLLLW